MAEKYEKLERMRADIMQTKNRIEKLQADLKRKEGKLKDAEAEQMLAEIYELAITPEQLGEFLEKYKADKSKPVTNPRIQAVMEVISDERLEESEDEE